jgi:tRNA(Ile)-lysidine synthase
MDLLDRVRRTIHRYDLVPRGGRVVVALSGGSDSVALTRLLLEIAASDGFHVVGAAHLNHQLRADADRDERFAADTARALGLQFVAERADVARRARAEGRSVEDAAHAARHEFLERARVALAAHLVALGHTRDDQAETFLLRLLRGAGPRGLAGMHPKQGLLIRPLLDCRREELRTYLETMGAEWVRDPSNDDVQVPRNRVRHELIPLIEARFNPAIVDVLAREADLARADWAWLERAAREAEAGLLESREAGQWSIDAEALAAQPEAVSRAILHRAMLRASGGLPVSFAHVERALDLALGNGPGFDGPGQRVERIGRTVVLSREPADSRGGRSRKPANLFQYSLSIPGEVDVTEAGCQISAEQAGSAREAETVLLSGPERAGALTGSGSAALLSMDLCPGPLAVRNRRPGDRFRPFGLAGRKKLQDFFVDRKVARDRRDQIPIVVDAMDRIVWVGGHRIAEEFRVMDPAQAVVVLRLKQSGGGA